MLRVGKQTFSSFHDEYNSFSVLHSFSNAIFQNNTFNNQKLREYSKEQYLNHRALLNKIKLLIGSKPMLISLRIRTSSQKSTQGMKILITSQNYIDLRYIII